MALIVEHFRAHLVDDRCDDLIKDHALVCCRREDLVKLIGLVAECARTHGELDCAAFDAVGRYNNAAVLAHFAVIATTTSHNNIDICFLPAVFEVGRLPLEW